MTYFPHHPAKHPATLHAAAVLASVREVLNRDLLCNRRILPAFKAPKLPDPRIELEPLRFAPIRVTQRSQPRR